MKKLSFVLTIIFFVIFLSACNNTGSSHMHDYTVINYNENAHWLECECKDKTAVEFHKGGTATCTDLAVCSVCSVEYGKLESHNYVDGICSNCNSVDANGTDTNKSGISEIAWNSMLDMNNFENFTFYMYAESPKGDTDTEEGVIKFDGNTISVNGGIVNDLDAIAIYKNDFIGIVLAGLDNFNNFTYDATNNVYNSNTQIVYELNVDGYDVVFTNDNVVVTIDANNHLSSMSCNMKQEFVETQGQESAQRELNVVVRFEFSDYGTTQIVDTNTNVDEIILLVDVSDSLNGVKSEVDRFVESVINANNGSKIGIVTFGNNQVYAAPLSSDTTDTYAKYLSSPHPDTTATNIAEALTYASNLFTSGGRSKIVLVSDGAENDGVATNVIKTVTARGISVDTVCISGQTPKNEVQILSLQVPDKIVVGQPFVAKATIQSSLSGVAAIRLFDNSIVGDEIEIELVEGVQTVSISYTLQLPGLHDISVQLVCDEDGLDINNHYTTCVYIEICDKILIIESIEGESESICTMLSEELNVSVINVSDSLNMPTTVNELREYDQVILVNVANKDMPIGFDWLLYEYVHDFGGGLFTVCGNKDDGNPYDDKFEANAYTREDMYGTVYQQMLPVEIVNYTPPVAVVIIIDNSASMSVVGADGMSNLDFAKESAIACLDALTDRDYIGIVTLSDLNNATLDLIPVTNRNKIISAIEQIKVGGGGTTFYNAFGIAGKMLSTLAGVEKKHIILVTDGVPTDGNDEYKYQVEENARNGITMSIVGIGCSDQDRFSMIELLEYGGMSKENFYGVTPNELHVLPMIMREDLSTPAIMSVNYETFCPTFGITDHAIIGNLNEADLPTLDGFYGVKAKEGAEVILKGPYSVPIYTQWKFGLGTVGTFTCDLNGIWSSDFIYSDTGRQLINNIVNNLFPTCNIRPNDFEILIKGDNYRHTVTVITDLEDGEYVELSVRGKDGVQVFTADATIGTRFSFNITSAGIHMITVQKKDSSGNLLSESVYYKAFSYSKEYDVFYDRESAAKNLENIAKSGNGNVIQSPADVFIFNPPISDDKEDEPLYDPNYYNVSILDVRTFWNDDNRCVIEVDIVSYRRDMAVDVYITVDGESVNGSHVDITIVTSVLLFDDEVTTISIGCSVDDFASYDEYLEHLDQFANWFPELYNLASFKSITARVNENDGVESDNVFTLQK